MNDDRWQRIFHLYDEAASRSQSERAQFLAAACGGDDVLRREVEKLLAEPISGLGFLRESALSANLPLPPESVLTGRSFGPYQIVKRLGAGGMGVVYHARDQKLRREVAIKILSRAVAADPAPLARFEREARILASLNHPHIAAIYGTEEREGIHALVLELVEGTTLSDRMAKDDETGGRIRFDEALDIARQIADALSAAHAKGVIHRDLKPANIKITRAGVVKVLDFGLAKIIADASALDPSDPVTVVSRTSAGVILGTPQYMAPEQLQGRPADQRSDIWSLGLLLYEMLSGQSPVEGPDALARMLSGLAEGQALAGVPAHVQSDLTLILRRALAPDPAERYQEVNDFSVDLERVRESLRGQRLRAPSRSSRVVARPASPASSPAATVKLPPPTPSASSKAPELAAEVPGSASGGGKPDIDLSAAEALIDVRNRQRLVREYRARASQVKDVEESVSRKVIADYDARHEDLERQAAPFIGRVREQYRRLRDVWGRVKQMDDEARLSRAEAELRHAVGEIDEAELAERVREPDRIRASCAQEIENFATIKSRFAEALGEGETESASTPVPTAREVDTARVAAPAPWQPAARDEKSVENHDDETLILPDAVLMLDGGGSATTFRLSAMTYVGRGEHNQIRLVSPRVSQRHALVIAGRDGYTIKDCDSAIGTFVNGARVTERKLEEGDRIRIGDLELVFQMRSRKPPRANR